MYVVNCVQLLGCCKSPDVMQKKCHGMALIITSNRSKSMEPTEFYFDFFPVFFFINMRKSTSYLSYENATECSDQHILTGLLVHRDFFQKCNSMSS